VETGARAAKEGRDSDWTLFNKDWTVVLRGARLTTTRWNQLHHRVKHADIAFYAGAHADVPVATLKAGASAARLLYLERQADGGDVYTFAKKKIQGFRVFFIAEGRHLQVDPETCRFALIVRRPQILVKARGCVSRWRRSALTSSPAPRATGSTAPVRQLSSKNLLINNPAPGFTQAVVDYRTDPGYALRIASGMDVVLAFACVCLADRFMMYESMEPDEDLRGSLLKDRFEDLEDQTRSLHLGRGQGTTLHISSLLY
jgi:hypothetical protein